VTAPPLEWGALVDVMPSRPVSDFPAMERARRIFCLRSSRPSEVGSQMNGGAFYRATLNIAWKEWKE
jgi:hypothetical protein